MTRLLTVLFLLLSATLFAQYNGPADMQATAETLQLFERLRSLMQRGVMFGHQDDMAYGIGWKFEHDRSDVKEVCGDWPAVFGWDIGHLEADKPVNLDSVPFDSLRSYIRAVYERGGVNSISWHSNNPVSGGSAWDTSLAVTAILPGGSSHTVYTAWLDRLADFMHSLKTVDGISIPVIFRPFHEHTGSWFWWGQRQCSTTEFRTLWQFTLNYLTTVKQVHNLLYAYSAADFDDDGQYMERYPGDAFVDIIGFDLYHSGSTIQYLQLLQQRLRILEAVAAINHKIPALTETGQERVPAANWWTQTLLPALQPFRLSYVLVRRNGRPDHYYAPYPGQASEADFKKFRADGRTLFLQDLK